ncbi:MAG: gamma-glutamylcyclotransferase [Halomonas sp.]|uniref:gamma-glutamylcyclotransferase n=1 Tax=Halomonas sp. TaxID=1486246 RepID=UPI003F9189D9
MTLDTTRLNQAMTHFENHQNLWLFGYGSLIWKAGFDYLERRPAWIDGWTRRFWQGSHDHRGTPEAPGRVATLIPDAHASCVGMAYLISPDTLLALDIREKNGYLRKLVSLRFSDNGSDKGMSQGLLYIATQDNAAWLGDDSIERMAQQIATASGPSGPNSDYLLHLDSALHELGASDPHVSALARQLRSRHPSVTSQQAKEPA